MRQIVRKLFGFVLGGVFAWLALSVCWLKVGEPLAGAVVVSQRGVDTIGVVTGRSTHRYDTGKRTRSEHLVHVEYDGHRASIPGSYRASTVPIVYDPQNPGRAFYGYRRDGVFTLLSTRTNLFSALIMGPLLFLAGLVGLVIMFGSLFAKSDKRSSDSLPRFYWINRWLS